jgi:hypothetical protein
MHDDRQPSRHSDDCALHPTMPGNLLKKQEDVMCVGTRFPGQWKNLGGLRVSPYTCDFGAKWLQIHATVRITDRRDPSKDPPWRVQARP